MPSHRRLGSLREQQVGRSDEFASNFQVVICAWVWTVERTSSSQPWPVQTPRMKRFAGCSGSGSWSTMTSVGWIVAPGSKS
jgi:hypothetical protein